MSFLEKNKDLILVHKLMDSTNVAERVNVMLTPEFYTMKKEALPVKYAYQAKKIAPSLFDGLLGDIAGTDYIVYRENDSWVFIAYNIEYITTFLESKGISRDKIDKVYFVQQAWESFTNPLVLGLNQALVVLNDTVVVVPKSSLVEDEIDEKNVLLFNKTFTPHKGGISLKGGGSDFLTREQTIMFTSIFLIFAAIFLVEGLRYSDVSGDDRELKSLYENYPKLKSGYARNGIIKKYRLLDVKERQKRNALKTFSSMIFKGVTLNALKLDDKKVMVQFICDSEVTAKKVQSMAKKAHYNTKLTKENNIVIIEGVL